MDHPRVSDVVVHSFTRMRTECFERFDPVKWLGMAAASWLAWLGAGQQSANFNFDGQIFQDVDLGELQPLVWMVAAGVGVLALVVWVALTFLRSRGQLMFIDLVARDDGDAVRSWTANAQRANELFRLRLLLDVIGGVLFAAPAGLGAAVSFLALDATSSGEWVSWVPLGIGAAVSLLLAFAWAFVTFWLDELVVPVAYAWQVPVLEAAAEVRRLIGAEPATFLVYLAVRVLSAVVVAWLALSLSCLLCAVAWIPFVSALFLLPFRIFLQGLPLALLHQVDHAAYGVFAPLDAPQPE